MQSAAGIQLWWQHACPAICDTWCVIKIRKEHWWKPYAVQWRSVFSVVAVRGRIILDSACAVQWKRRWSVLGHISSDLWRGQYVKVGVPGQSFHLLGVRSMGETAILRPMPRRGGILGWSAYLLEDWPWRSSAGFLSLAAVCRWTQSSRRPQGTPSPRCHSHWTFIGHVEFRYHPPWNNPVSSTGPGNVHSSGTCALIQSVPTSTQLHQFVKQELLCENAFDFHALNLMCL